MVRRKVRCRTIGDITCTGVTLSEAHTLEDIIEEIAASRVTERGGRADDKRSETAMEDRKQGISKSPTHKQTSPPARNKPTTIMSTTRGYLDMELLRPRQRAA